MAVEAEDNANAQNAEYLALREKEQKQIEEVKLKQKKGRTKSKRDELTSPQKMGEKREEVSTGSRWNSN